MSNLKDTTADVSGNRLQFGMTTIFVVMTWIACTVFLLLNTTLAVAVLAIFLLTIGFYEAVLSTSARRAVRDRVYSAFKVAFVLAVLVAALVGAAISPYCRIAYQPMYNRAERARMAAIARVLAQDERFNNVHVHLGEFKGFQSFYLEGSVPDANTMEDLKQVLADEADVHELPTSVKIEKGPDTSAVKSR